MSQVDYFQNNYKDSETEINAGHDSGAEIANFINSGGRIPPNSLEAEQSVIGAILIDNDVINSVLENIRVDDFYHVANRIIFSAMLELSEKRRAIDAITLCEELRLKNELSKVGGIEYISRLIDSVPTSANTSFYSRIIREMSVRRKIINVASTIVEDAFQAKTEVDEFIDGVEQKIFQVSEDRINPSFTRIGDIVKGSIKRVEELYASNESITGIPSGFVDLDEMTSGFQPSDLIIIAGRPAMGKTSLALSIAKYVAIQTSKPVAIFSLEMSKEQISLRMLCSEAKVGNSKVRNGKLAESDFPRLIDAAAHLDQAPLYIDDTPAISTIELRAKARRLHKERGLGMIVIDYLQLMKSSKRNAERREQEISEISGSLKALAKELNIPVIALSQLNRSVESRTDKRPIMADLRESGAIEQDADIIGFVYRDEVYNPETKDKGVAELIISKHRNGPVGTVRMSFQGDYTLFDNLAAEEYDYLGAEMVLPDSEDSGF